MEEIKREIAELKKEKAARELEEKQAKYAREGIRNKKSSIQSVSQSNFQSKRDVPPAKRSKFGGGRPDLAGTA